ncbi:MAG: ABC transporter substrate-binding protein [Alphaproteobacteria bacterium]|nr:ABC transporter substrate-binding protein [Alphaproteobacteria bacterium]
MKRRAALAGLGVLAAGQITGPACATTVGVTKTEIKIGNTSAYSGNASAYSIGAKSAIAYLNMVNAKGGINGRKLNVITLDDGYNPAKTVEQVRRLVEQDQVACLFALLGTAPNSAIHRYVNQKQVPHLFVASGAAKWADPEHFPWTIGWGPSYRVEGQIYAKYMLKERPQGRIAIMYQNDDLGKDYIAGVRDIFGAEFDKRVVKMQSYEVTDTTIDSPVVTLRDSGADCLISACTPKFGAQLIRRAFDINWKPLHCMSNVSSSVSSVMVPAGKDKGVGIITSTYIKDPNDPAWAKDRGMGEYREFMAKYATELDMNDVNTVVGTGYAKTLVQCLTQCGDDLSRENIMRQAANIKDLDIGILFPGILINTSPTNFRPIRQMQLTRWTGEFWQVFGDLIEGA